MARHPTKEASTSARQLGRVKTCSRLAGQDGPDEDDEEPAGPLAPPLDLLPGTLLVAVGPAASGKSTYAATSAVDVLVCLDSLRREIGGDFSNRSCMLNVGSKG